MSRTLACIVEGHGDTLAVPVLLRRLAEVKEDFQISISPPIRVHKDQFIRRDDEFRRKLLLAVAKAQGGAVIILLDADDDCPVSLASSLRARAQKIAPASNVHTVIACREYESWLIAGIGPLAGKRRVRADATPPPNPDEIRDAKGWISEQMLSGRYHEVVDQPAMTATFDLQHAQAASRSFRKFIESFSAILESFAAHDGRLDLGSRASHN